MLQASPHGPVTPLHMGQTVLSRTIRTVEAYLVDDLLIDSGPPATAVELARWFRHRELRRIVDTHHHEDHAGGNTVLPEAFGVQVSAPDGALSILRDPPRLELYDRVVWGQPSHGGRAAWTCGEHAPVSIRRDSHAGALCGPRLLLRAKGNRALQRRPLHPRQGALLERP